MKRAISLALVISTAAMTQLHAGGHPGGERPFAAPPPPIRQVPQPRAPEPRIEPERPVGTTPSGDVRKAEQQREMAAAAEKEWAERPRSEEEKNNLTESRPQEQSTRQLQQQKQAAQQQQRIAQEQTTPGRLSFDEARARMTRERHDRAWWNERYNRIVRAGTGFYVFDEGYWLPALGYDPDADIYAYEGPIYALGNMTPDQEVAAVQERLEADGYYSGSITGVLDSGTQQAIAKFQADSGLLATGAIDQPTIEALGLA